MTTTMRTTVSWTICPYVSLTLSRGGGVSWRGMLVLIVLHAIFCGAINTKCHAYARGGGGGFPVAQQMRREQQDKALAISQGDDWRIPALATAHSAAANKWKQQYAENSQKLAWLKFVSARDWLGYFAVALTAMPSSAEQPEKKVYPISWGAYYEGQAVNVEAVVVHKNGTDTDDFGDVRKLGKKQCLSLDTSQRKVGQKTLSAQSLTENGVRLVFRDCLRQPRGHDTGTSAEINKFEYLAQVFVTVDGSLRPFLNVTKCVTPANDINAGAQISLQHCGGVFDGVNKIWKDEKYDYVNLTHFKSEKRQQWVRISQPDSLLVPSNASAPSSEKDVDFKYDDDGDDSKYDFKYMLYRKTKQLAWAKSSDLCLGLSVQLYNAWFSTTLRRCKETKLKDVNLHRVNCTVLTAVSMAVMTV